uniref:Putative secreted protein n=1 Tax=Ixodes ricinus TaxID=34613 RepID=A0A6B0U105_IXORI
MGKSAHRGTGKPRAASRPWACSLLATSSGSQCSSPCPTCSPSTCPSAGPRPRPRCGRRALRQVSLPPVRRAPCRTGRNRESRADSHCLRE